MNKKAIVIVMAAILFVSGCASIVSKSLWAVTITSSPDRADVSVIDVRNGSNVFTGKTPTTITLSSKGGFFQGRTYRVEVSKHGYAPRTTEIRSTLNGWYIGNILFGGLIGMLIVDPATGAMWTLDPKDINLTLEEQAAEESSDRSLFSVMSVNDVPEGLRHKMVEIKVR